MADSKWVKRLSKAEALRAKLVDCKALKVSHVVDARRLAKADKKVSGNAKLAKVAKAFGKAVGKLEKLEPHCDVWPAWLPRKAESTSSDYLSTPKLVGKKRARSDSCAGESEDDGEDKGEEKKKKDKKKVKKGNKNKVDDEPDGAASSLPRSPASTTSVVPNKDGVTLLLFYAYVEPDWDEATHKQVLSWAEGVLSRCGVTGRLRVAKEGFNGTLTGDYDGMREFCQCVRDFNPKNFEDVDFKLTDGLPEGQRFPKLNVFAVSELVNYGLAKEKAPSIAHHGGVHLPPAEFHKKLEEPNTVVIDVRNSYEAAIGRFDPPEGGATYVDPKMRLSTEFPDWIDRNLEDLKSKQVLMYCTGGVRCERASALLKSRGHNNGVYQLGGGIHKYLEDFATDGGHWIGKNYTFDKRFAHGAPGVEGTEKDNVVGNCAACQRPWDKYRGRKRCPQCAVPLLVCMDCQKQKKHSLALCSLCQEDKEKGKIFQRPGDAAGPKGVGVRLQAKQAKVNKCGKCEQSFKSRNALFKHLQESGHQTRGSKKQQPQPYGEQDFCG